MSEWLPDTDHVREMYCQDAITSGVRQVYEREFDRWLAARDAKIWDEAVEKVMEIDVIRIPDNPYRSER